MTLLQLLKNRLLAWHLKPTDTQNYDFLDGLRGVAILLVLGCHLVYCNPHATLAVKFIAGIFGAGGCGVTLFFCLSGYLVSLPFWKRKKLGKLPSTPAGYGQRRFFKIYPPLVLSILVLTPLYIYIHSDPAYLVPAAEWLVGLPVLFPVDGRLNPVMWSLIIEIQFYALLPMIMFVFTKTSMRNSIWMIPLLLVVIGVSARCIFVALGIHGTLEPKLYMPFLSDMDMFAMGVFVAGLYSMGSISKPWAKLGNIGVVIILAMLPLMSLLNLDQKKSMPDTEAVNLALKLGFGCMLFFVADGDCFVARCLCHPLLRWFGTISYEWYLFHQPIAIWLRNGLGPANGSILTYAFIIGGAFIISLIVSALVYRYFSLPILIYARNRHKRLANAMPPQAVELIQRGD